MKEIKGIIVPILTPMHEDETVNYEELVNQIERLIAAGVHGIFVFGTNGEGYILDEEEKAETIRVAVKAVRGRVPVYAGTGCVSTRDTIRMSRKAKELGADVLSIITPSFAAASQEEIIHHYETVANAVDMPILLYNIPPAQATLWPPPQCKSCLRWQTLWAQRIPAVTLTISCSISRKHAGAINRSPCCPATIP